MRIFRPLDRYVFSEFWKIFIDHGARISVPARDHRPDRSPPERISTGRFRPRDIALSYLFWIPDSMFMVLPAAVLFATVFSIGAFTRHAEVTAAKASGISFYRLIVPDPARRDVRVRARPRRSARSSRSRTSGAAELLQEDKAQVGTSRFNFAFAGEYGRVYKAYELRTDSGRIRQLQIERKGKGPAYPTYVLTADSALVRRAPGRRGRCATAHLHVVSDTAVQLRRSRSRRRATPASPSSPAT